MTAPENAPADSPLHIAAFRSAPDTVRALVELGAEESV